MPESVQPRDPLALRDSASAFAREWVLALNDAYMTLDSGQLAALSAPECMTCQAYIKSMAESKSTGQSWVGGLHQVAEAVAAPMNGDTTEVLIRYDTTEFYVLERSGARTSTQPAEPRGVMQLAVKRSDDSWLATEVAQL